jgi:short subunit dehydrogenase-like uncharacterized protein
LVLGFELHKPRIKLLMTFDIVLFGATGYTGRLVAENLQSFNTAAQPLRWAMAGRSLEKLKTVRAAIGAPESLPLLVAEATDAVAIGELVRQTRLVITTVGPYQRYGDVLVDACAREGTDYVDLCGESTWMATKVRQLGETAKRSGARIVFSCGFDSVPFDLGVVFLQTEALRRFGKPLEAVQGVMRVMKGGFSGGTIASAMATIEASERDPRLAATMQDPFALTPGFEGPIQPDGASAKFLDSIGVWSGPFVMAPINTKNVHRTNHLLDHLWGRDFTYEERMQAGKGEQGRRRAVKMARNARWQNRLLGFPPVRWCLQRWVLPKPGEGPTAQQRESGQFEIVFVGQAQSLRAVVTGDRDPGYGSTARMLAQSALCLLHEADRSVTSGGVWTPGAAMGMLLVQRLREHAGLTFEIDPAVV